MDIKELNKVPEKYGVYCWKNKWNEIIYVGKTNNLRKRMQQYLQGRKNSYKTDALVRDIESFEFNVCNNEKEALILERQFIEQFRPIYNIKFLDHKNYPYLMIKLDKKITISVKWNFKNKIQKNNVFFYGPIPTSNWKSLKDFLEREAFHENGLPIKNESAQYWKEKFEKIKIMLSPKNGSYIKELEKKYLHAIEMQNFEIARDIDNCIKQLKNIHDDQSVELINQNNLDVVALISKNNKFFIQINFYRAGKLISNYKYTSDFTQYNEVYFLNYFLNDFYKNTFIPDQIVLDYKFHKNEFLFDFLIPQLIFPQKGKLKKALNLAYLNLEENITEMQNSFNIEQTRIASNLEKFKKITKVDSLYRFGIFDNSHLGNTDVVSKLVVFVNGKENTSENRQFKIDAEEDTRKADVAYLAKALRKWASSDNRFELDTLIVDGGIGHIHEAKKILSEFAINIPVIGLVKNDKHTTEYLIDANEKKVTIKDQVLLNYLRYIQDLVDKKAKSFHHKRKIQNTLEGTLSKIKGLSPEKENQLITYFGSYSAIYNASIEELNKIVSKRIAEEIYKKMRKE